MRSAPQESPFLTAAYFFNFGAERNIFQYLCCLLQSGSMSNHSGKHVAAIVSTTPNATKGAQWKSHPISIWVYSSSEMSNWHFSIVSSCVNNLSFVMASFAVVCPSTYKPSKRRALLPLVFTEPDLFLLFPLLSIFVNSVYVLLNEEIEFPVNLSWSIICLSCSPIALPISRPSKRTLIPFQKCFP